MMTLLIYGTITLVVIAAITIFSHRFVEKRITAGFNKLEKLWDWKPNSLKNRLDKIKESRPNSKETTKIKYDFIKAVTKLGLQLYADADFKEFADQYREMYNTLYKIYPEYYTLLASTPRPTPKTLIGLEDYVTSHVEFNKILDKIK